MQSVDLHPVIRKAHRQIWGGAIYRSLATFFFLVVCFQRFPASQAVFALGVIAFNQGLGVVVSLLTLMAERAARVDDNAERKTRHTIVLASQWDWQGDRYTPGGEFWGEVNKRVDAEYEEQDPPPKWWKGWLLVLGSLVATLIGDLIMIALATMFSGSSY